MDRSGIIPQRIPKAPFERRVYAFLIDFIVVWLISSLVTNLFLEFIIFVALWLVLRVIIVQTNKGQSLGRWALDLKIFDLKYRRLPSLLTLTKREGIISIGAFVAMIGFKINFKDVLLMLLFLVPLIIDGIAMVTDEKYNQAFHDRICDTIIVQTKRGFSLDLRVKKLIQEAKETWTKNQRRDK